MRTRKLMQQCCLRLLVDRQRNRFQKQSKSLSALKPALNRRRPRRKEEWMRIRKLMQQCCLRLLVDRQRNRFQLQSKSLSAHKLALHKRRLDLCHLNPHRHNRFHRHACRKEAWMRMRKLMQLWCRPRALHPRLPLNNSPIRKQNFPLLQHRRLCTSCETTTTTMLVCQPMKRPTRP